MRLLITGGAGYIGSHTTRLFQKLGHEVVVFDNLRHGHREALSGCRLIVGDLGDTALLESIFARERFDAVVHFAALTAVGESVQDPSLYYWNNVAGTISLLEAVRQSQTRRIVFSSTAAVYGNPQEIPLRETHPAQPINPYGRTKLVIEQVLQDYSSAYGLGCAVLRYFNAAGADPSAEIGEDHTPETHLIPLVLQVALGQRRQIDVFGTNYPTPDGTCVRDYIHVNDLASAHVKAVEKITPGRVLTVNLGTGRGYSVREVIEACRRITGREITYHEADARPGDPAELVACGDAARSVLGWEPVSSDLDTIIETAWNWHRSHPNGYARSTETQTRTLPKLVRPGVHKPIQTSS